MYGQGCPILNFDTLCSYEIISRRKTSTMTYFGIICPASTGHLNLMTTLGYELQRQGHRVTVVGVLDTEEKAQAQ